MFNLFYALLAITVFFGVLAGLLVVAVQRERSALSKRISTVVLRGDEGDESHMRTSENVARKVSFIASIIRVRLGAQANESVQERFIAAGIRIPKASDLYFVFRVLTPVIFCAAGYFASHKLLVAIACAVVGFFIPGLTLNHLVKRYRTKIRRALADVMDLLVVCVDAGLGIDQAILRTAREMSIAYPEVCYEFLETNRERQAGLTRTQAWENLVKRTGVDELETMVSMLNQADQLGTPLAVGLRNFADTVRTQRRLDAEEQAGRASVLLLIPLVLFIFPTVFIVIMGPAVMSLMGTLGNGVIPK